MIPLNLSTLKKDIAKLTANKKRRAFIGSPADLAAVSDEEKSRLAFALVQDFGEGDIGEGESDRGSSTRCTAARRAPSPITP